MKMKNRVLAVLALALLMINMASVREAKAAETNDGVYYPSVFDCDFGSFAEGFDVALEKCEYFWVTYRNGFYNFGFIDSNVHSTPVQLGLSYSEYCLSYNYLFTVTGSNLSVSGFNDLSNRKDGVYAVALKSGETFLIGTNFDIQGANGLNLPCNNLTFPAVPEPEPLILPVTEPGYEYWLYHKTTSGEYMYWSKDPFDLEVSEGKYLLNLSTGDIVYRLHLSPSHTYYRQILSGSMQYVISSGDIFRSGQELVFDDVTIDAWTEGDVTSEEVQAPQYNIPYITKFLKRVRTARSYADKPREYSFSIDLALSGDFDAAVTEQKVLIDGNYIMPSEEYFYFCDSENIEPSTTHFMNLVKSKQEKYYIYVDWSHIESIVNLAGLTSDYGFRLTYSNAVDALIERGEFDVLYSKSIQAAYDDDIRRLCCPYRLACTLIGVVGEEYYYGDTYITVLYSELDKAIEDVSGVYSDYVSLDNDQRTDAIESTINGAQDDKLQDYIDKKDAELDALIEEYEMKLATLDGSLASGGSGDLFGTFSRIANGVSGMSGSFRNIATAVGNVFAFFPDEITTLLYAGFIALIVIAVYKALRG